MTTKAELSVCNKTCSLALTVGWLQNTSLGMTISILTTAPCGCSVKEGTSLILVCAQVIDWVQFPTAAHPEPCNSNPIRCLERNN